MCNVLLKAEPAKYCLEMWDNDRPMERQDGVLTLNLTSFANNYDINDTVHEIIFFFFLPLHPTATCLMGSDLSPTLLNKLKKNTKLIRLVGCIYQIMGVTTFLTSRPSFVGWTHTCHKFEYLLNKLIFTLYCKYDSVIVYRKILWIMSLMCIWGCQKAYKSCRAIFIFFVFTNQ